MQTREWAFGTIIPCEVLDIESAGPVDVLVCKSDDYPGEGFICIYEAGTIAAAVGDRGTLTFEQGGPHGGHFRFRGNDSSQPRPI